MSLVHLPEGLIFRIEDFIADHDRIEEFRDVHEALNFYSDAVVLLRQVRDTIRAENAPGDGVLPPSGGLPPSLGAEGMILKPRREFLPMLPPERSNTARPSWIGG